MYDSTSKQTRPTSEGALVSLAAAAGQCDPGVGAGGQAVNASNPTENVVDALRVNGSRPTRDGNGWRALCPNCDASAPTLTITPRPDGGVLVRCTSGCTTAEILVPLGLDGEEVGP